MPNSGVSLRFLGCGDAFGSGGRFQTCFFVESSSGAFLIDCGASSLVALKAADIALDHVDSVLISHLHGDHFGGIPFLLLDAHIVSKRTAPLTIAGPPGLEERVRATLELLFPGTSTVEPAFALDFVELEAGETRMIGQRSVTPVEVVHPSGAPSYALRVVVDDHLIAYSGDTEWTDRLPEVAAGADLFICEASRYAGSPRFHLDYVTIRERLEELDCGRLVLTHMGEEMLANLDRVEIETAYDGLVIDL